ncbi:MAG: inorganic diphosphatase, partial [Bacteroidaceae bacterium]|nr:inorganic diphosphatase [Bacteroidaceae bacterium]
VATENGLHMLFAKIDNKVLLPGTVDYTNAGTYFIYYGEGAQAVAEAIFGPSLRDGVTYSEEKISRKQIVPKLTEILH